MRPGSHRGVTARGRERAARIIRPLRLRLRLRDDRRLPSVDAAIPAIIDRWEVPAAPDSPVLLFASAWRSGSTLLQRLVLSSGEVLVWGEPWNRTELISRLGESLRPLANGWPEYPVFIDEVRAQVDRLEEAWTANLFPEPAALVESHRALFRELYAVTAQKEGYDQWGLKLVQSGVNEMAYFRFLFPEARMVFIYRNPYESWASYRAAKWTAFERFPDQPVLRPAHFGTMWARKVQTVLAAADRLGVLCIRYEDLITRAGPLDHQLEQHLGLTFDWSVLDHVVGSTNSRQPSGHERRVIAREAGDLAAALGYVS